MENPNQVKSGVTPEDLRVSLLQTVRDIQKSGRELDLIAEKIVSLGSHYERLLESLRDQQHANARQELALAVASRARELAKAELSDVSAETLAAVLQRLNESCARVNTDDISVEMTITAMEMNLGMDRISTLKPTGETMTTF